MKHLVLKTAFAAGLSLSALSAQAFFGMDKTHAFNSSQEEAIVDLVKKTIQDDPKMVIDALVAYQQAEQAKKIAASKAVVADHIDDVINSGLTPLLGNADGHSDVVVYEFMDYRCGHCKSVAAQVETFLKDNQDARVVVRELPIFGGVSTDAAKAALAAERQHKFAEMHKAIFEKSPELNEEALTELAKGLGVNLDQFKKDMADQAITDAVDANLALSKTLKIAGTPGFIVVNTKTKKSEFFPGEVSAETLTKTFKDLS